MAEIEWKTYIEPVKHMRAEVTEDNILDFAREFGWTVQYVEKRVAPSLGGRATVMVASGVRGASRDSIELPFWVDLRGEHPYVTSAPRADWKVES